MLVGDASVKIYQLTNFYNNPSSKRPDRREIGFYHEIAGIERLGLKHLTMSVGKEKGSAQPIIAMGEGKISAAGTGGYAVQLYSIVEKKFMRQNIPGAHRHPIAAVTLSRDADLVATISRNGTIVRVFDVAWGNLRHEFRRSIQTPADVRSLHFSADSSFVSLATRFDTLHVFDLRPVEARGAGGSWMGAAYSGYDYGKQALQWDVDRRMSDGQLVRHGALAPAEQRRPDHGARIHRAR